MGRTVLLWLWLTTPACEFTHGSFAADASVADTYVPLRDCREAFEAGVISDGVIAIDPDGIAIGSPPYDVYCDMTTAGGGWTLVYAYGFTVYSNFVDSGNAVTPRPNWPFSSTQSVPISVTTPLSPTRPGAIDFARWRDFGSELLITSTINHWIVCQPGTGSLITATNGSVACVIVNVVATACTNVVPAVVTFESRGPGLSVTSALFSTAFYYWEGSTSSNWPTHDPCGTNAPRQLVGVADPRGAIFVRRP